MIGIQPSTAADHIVAQGLARGLLLNIAGGDTIHRTTAVGHER